MNDLIDRQAAIDLIERMKPYHQDADDIAEMIANMSSAEPEIIYCKKCEHWTRTYGNEQWGLGDCDVFDKHLVRCNGYCAWAERRTDENNNE